MLLDFAADKEKAAIEIPRSDPRARQAFLDEVAAPVANKLFECGMIPRNPARGGPVRRRLGAALLALAVALALSFTAAAFAQAQDEEQEEQSPRARKLAEEFSDPLTTLPQIFTQDVYTPANYGTRAQANRFITRLIVPRLPRYSLFPLVQLVRPSFSLVTVPTGRGSTTRTAFGDGSCSTWRCCRGRAGRAAC